ncbi:hypothetical protein GGX14DRAFT_484852 [Mycena pura]|uniref:Arrestin-like N-terminal domain-containing protein n=1 Tax=Mycena pura TaxID=153505 RepID=A0AAD6UMB7_9AGAR|nr:hypothetical protein GGX14DRAFT_484852 [Mycena pura]
MAPKSSTKAPVFVLYFPDAVRVAGETIQGRVELDVARAQDDGVENVCVNLRGSIVTTIIETNCDGSDTKHERTIQLIDSGRSLWERGAAYPLPGCHTLVLPFEFKLPDNLPPSFHLAIPQHEAVISYTIEVVGRRPDLLRKDRRIRQNFAVLPAASPEQVLAKTSLKQGWGGLWRTTSLEQKLRQGIWGDYSHARAELKVPKLTSFPRATALPVKFYVETRTKPMSRTAAPEDKHHKPLFPAPPVDSTEVKLYFHREATIRTRRRHGTLNDSCQTLGSLGDPASTSVTPTVGVPQWVPDPEKKDRGVWKRSVQFETTLTLPFAPSFSTETVDCKYFLRFTVSFPGIGNDLNLDVPIRLDPAHPCPAPDNINYAYIPPDGPPPLPDSPPSYLSALERDDM